MSQRLRRLWGWFRRLHLARKRLRNGPPQTTEIDVPKIALGSTMVFLQGALGDILLRFSEFHGRRAGPWLDAIEADLLNDAKNGEFVGVPIEFESRVVEFTLAVLQSIFGEVRGKLDNNPDSN